MSTPQMSKAVLAMRLKIALMRHRVSIDDGRLLGDSVYAAEVIAQCRALGQPELIALAEKFSGDAAATPPPPGAADPAAAAHAGTSSPRIKPADPADAAPPPPEGPGPDDPTKKNQQRYLRGAR